MRHIYLFIFCLGFSLGNSSLKAIPIKRIVLKHWIALFEQSPHYNNTGTVRGDYKETKKNNETESKSKNKKPQKKKIPLRKTEKKKIKAAFIQK